MKSVILVLDRSGYRDLTYRAATRGFGSRLTGGKFMVKYAALGAAVVALAACQDTTSPRATPAVPSSVNAAQGSTQNDYIVVLRDDESDPDGQASAAVKAHGGSLKHVYRTALKGYAIGNLPDAAVEALRRNPRVARIERDGIMTADGSGSQTGATWGIDRIDQRARPVDGVYNYGADGSGVTAYIIDTGIRTTHSEFGGRASSGYTAINDGNGTNDCNGHGTHVAGTVGGSTYGVAQNVTLVAVRVLGCSGSGSTSGVIAGIDWVTANHAAGVTAVANMSLGGGASLALDDAIARSVSDGVTYAVAAGNDNANACNYSPARAASAITVGSTTSSDAKSSFSNYGTCVDINAPGSSITSAWSTSDGALNTISGTSMASPHVAGAAAAYLSANSGASPSQVANALTSNATSGVLSGIGNGTPDRLLFVGFIGGGTVTPPPSGPTAPVAGLTKSCNVFDCTFTSTSTGTIDTYEWNVDGVITFGGTSRTKSYLARQSGSVTLKVKNGTSASTATVSVVCNPKKCQ
jgi:aqualysin 1